MEDFTPFLQIVHISDLHFKDPEFLYDAWLRDLIRILRKVISKERVDMIEDGLQGHNDPAGLRFTEFLSDITTEDREWSKCKTWLIDTGDLTTFGDQNSLNLGRSYLARLAQICPEMAAIYGNHDAWPGKFPLFAASASLKAQMTTLTTQTYPLSYTVATPVLALQAPIPHRDGNVQLYFVDSVMHDRWHNWRAVGKVQDPQLEALKTLIDRNYETDRRDFRILAVHHPIHYPPPRSPFWMSMSNDTEVAKILGVATPKGAFPLAHLVLSGHTHFLFPKHGELPLQPSLCQHPDLGNDQCQFVVGTLMQLDRFKKRPKWPHQCEVLRLYYSSADHSVLLMERLLAARQTGNIPYAEMGIGSYRFVPLPQNNNEIAEEISFAV